ncbi:MAG: site-specific integrase, partial [Bacteroidales bacterium]|nr:site-specific integrase [Bacteroidales bacterium]
MYKAKEPVKLRQQKIKDGNTSLYLDYNLNGKRIREYLKLYLIPEHEVKDKERNRETLRLATAVKAQRITELQNGSTGFRPT